MALKHATIELCGKGKALLVLGMHRSGTSAVAGCLAQLGVHLGRDLLPAIPGENDKGFWEQRAIVVAHDVLLAELGSSWDDVRALPHHWWELPAAVKAHASLLDTLLRDVMRDGFWGIKDPRMCRLLPLWHALFARIGVEPRYVFVLRHPWEIFDSLGKRNGFSRQKCGLMYLHHMVAAERATRNLPRAFVQYDELLRDPASTFLRVSESLGLGLDGAVDAAHNQLSGFVSAQLRHHAQQVHPTQSGMQENNDRILEMVMAVYTSMQALGAGADSSALVTLDRLADDLVGAADSCPAAVNEHISQIVHRSRDVTRYALALKQEVQKLTSGAQAQRDAFERSIEASSHFVESLQGEIQKVTTAAHEEIQGLKSSLKESGRYVCALQNQVKQLQTEACAAIAAFEQSKADSKKYAQALEQEVQKLQADARAAVAAFDATSADAKRRAEVLEAQIVALTSGAQSERALYEQSALQASRYAESLELEIRKLERGAREERAAYESSHAQAKEYADALECEIRKVTLAASQDRANHEQARAVSETYVASLQLEIARLSGPPSPPTPS